jgi:hypothetical protein
MWSCAASRKPPVPPGGIADRHPRLRPHDLDDGPDQRAWGEVLAGASLDVLGVLGEQALVGVAFDIGIQAGPLLAVDQVGDQPAQFRRVLDLVLGFAEDDAQHPLLTTERLERVAVLDLQLVAIALEQLRPGVVSRNA